MKLSQIVWGLILALAAVAPILVITNPSNDQFKNGVLLLATSVITAIVGALGLWLGITKDSKFEILVCAVLLVEGGFFLNESIRTLNPQPAPQIQPMQDVEAFHNGQIAFAGLNLQDQECDPGENPGCDQELERASEALSILIVLILILGAFVGALVYTNLTTSDN